MKHFIEKLFHCVCEALNQPSNIVSKIYESLPLLFSKIYPMNIGRTAPNTVKNSLTRKLGCAIMNLQRKLGMEVQRMNKEEILAASRKENKNQDIAEAEYLKQASRAAYPVGCIVCWLICALQFAFIKTINWGCWVVDFSILGTICFVKSIKSKKRHDILMTVINYGFCVFFAIGFIMSLRG